MGLFKVWESVMTRRLVAIRCGLVCIVGAAAALGCSSSHNNDEDSSISFDATFPDAADAGSVVGRECSDDSMCADGICITDLPGGYCSAVCVSSDECPGGSVCVMVGMGSSVCLDSCDPLGTDECRPGYGCAVGAGAVCIPGCEEDADCEGGAECDPSGGFSGEGRCFNPDASLGDACDGSDQCGSGSFCLSERRWGFPGGACGAFGCDLASNTGCPDDGQCLEGGRGTICLDGCAVDEDCRAEYECVDSLANPGRMTCQPAFVPENLGTVCSAGRGDCTGGLCLSESETGWPDSYCVAVGCDPEAAVSECPGDGVCIAAGDEGGICVDGCETVADCRAGYACRNADSEDPTSATACMPGCEDSSVCGNDEFVCNPGTGRCTEPFVEANLGQPCAGPEDCVGGRCLDEPTTGWPAGTCAFGGCRLSGTGPEATCPTGSRCVDDAAGNPELGVCVTDCAGAGTCRPGYGCTDEACIPACGTDDCGAGRMCNMTNGLCE